MHRWAQIIERASQALGQNYKQDGVTNPVGEFGRYLSLFDQQRDGLYVMSESDRQHFIESQNDFERMLIALENGGGAQDGTR